MEEKKEPSQDAVREFMAKWEKSENDKKEEEQAQFWGCLIIIIVLVLLSICIPVCRDAVVWTSVH